MNQSHSSQAQDPAASSSLSDSEFRYYVSGFHAALKRYRLMTLAGWLIVAVGCMSFPFGWSIGRQGGLIEILLSIATIVAGLVVVWQSNASLEAYVRIVQPRQHNGELNPPVVRILEIMHDVDQGGWMEANIALRQLEDLQHQLTQHQSEKEK